MEDLNICLIDSDIDIQIIKTMVFNHINSREYLKNLFESYEDNLSIDHLSIKLKDDDDIDKSNIEVDFRFKLGKSRDLIGLTNNFFKNTNYISIPYREYLVLLREKKLASLGLSLGDKVKINIDKYLEFDSSELFTENGLVSIFGGSVRDSICGDEINDVDILCGSKSIRRVNQLLINNGYKFMESLAPKDLASVYSDIHVICEPHTWIKGDKIVQLIRPAISTHDLIDKYEFYKEGFDNLIANVDISCCGVSYNSSLIENFKNAILHCQKKVFYVNENALMYSEARIHHRIHKFTSRGWNKIETNESDINRDLKIEEILNI